MISAGAAFSSFLNNDTKARFGYQYGLSVRIYRIKAFSFSSAVLYTQLKNSANNLQGEYIDNDGTIYRAIYNLDFSASFIKIPVLFNYDIIDKKNFTLTVGAGPGYSIAFSNKSKTAGYEITDEIIGYLPGDQGPAELGGVNDFTGDNSGFDFTALINTVLYKYYCIGFSYNLQFNDILKIDKLNYFALNLSLKI